MKIDNELLERLLERAGENPRMRQNMDLRTSTEDCSQRMLNALLPGTKVPVHRHPRSNESMIILKGRLDAILCDDNGTVTARYQLDPSSGHFGCVMPAGTWHTVEVMEPSVIYSAMDGRYGEDGSESVGN